LDDIGSKIYRCDVLKTSFMLIHERGFYGKLLVKKR